jgi:hypothetical protein
MRSTLRQSARRAFLSLLLVAMAAFALANQLDAQVVGATVSGTVKDASGSAIPGAKVSVKNVATGVVRELDADAAGFYTLPNLLPGNYEVSFSAQGFGTQTANITLTVGAQQVVNATLTVGQVNQKVVVSVEAPIVELASSTVSGEVSATTVRELPLNGRSWTDLAALSPGVDTIRTQTDFSAGSDRGNRGFGQQLAISGARPQQNNYRLDGASLNDYANGAPGSVLGGNLGVDAIQEFTVLTSNYSAEYGKTSGGVVNATTRSGSNALHGSAYEFLRNSKLDAANFFERGQRTPFKRNQFGGAIGGPIVKDRTFFFADYEGIRLSKSIPTVDTVPSANARLGMLSSGTVPVSAAAQGYLALYPTPTCAPGLDACQFVFSGEQVINENFVTGRVDHKLSDKDSLFGTYLFDRTPYSAPDGFGNVELGHLTTRQFVAAEETHNFGTSFVNAARFGFNRSSVDDNRSLRPLKTAASDALLGAFQGRDASYVNIGSNQITPMPGGVGGLPTYFYRWNSFQAYDDAFWTRGTHSIKFGVAVERMQSQVIADTDPNGVWTFPDLSSFLQNLPSKFQGGIHSQVAPRNMRQTLFGVYVQDDWRARPSLTLNLGLRWEMTTVPTETSGKFVNLRNLSDHFPVCGVVVTGSAGAQECAGAGPIFTANPTLRDFEPRIGFAWDALHNGRLAVRGGAGIFDVLPLPYQFTLMETQAAPFFSYTTVTKCPPPPQTCGPGNFTQPNAFPSVGLPSPLPGSSLRGSYIESKPKRDYVTQWNLNVQYQFTPTLAAMVAYVGSRGVHLPYRVDDADWVLPTVTSLGDMWPNSNAPGTRINTNYGSIHGMFYQGRSYYNAFEAQVSKRMSHGFQLQGVYTWAKSMDTSSATVAGDAFQNSISSLDWYDVRLSRALSDFNVGRTFVLSGTWDAPSPKSLSGFARWPLDGWELGLIFTVSDGVPFTATWGGGNDPASTGSSDGFAYPNRSTSSDCKTLVNPGNPDNYIKSSCFSLPTVPSGQWATIGPGGCDSNFGQNTDPLAANYLTCANLRGNAGRNILIGPGLTDVDFSVYKNNYIKRISEGFNVQFRAEFFNILNHANFGPPTPGDTNADVFDGSIPAIRIQNPGALVRTVTPERQIQFALKVVF